MSIVNRLILVAVLAGAVLIPAACSDDADPAVVLNCSDADSPDNADADGDGFSPCQGDCDDNDAAASPDGVEESETDGYDQDCDNFNPTRE